MLSTQEIERIIPHRYPFLLVDRVVELVKQHGRWLFRKRRVMLDMQQ